MNVALIYTRHLYPQISTIVILCGIFVAMVAQNGKGSQECVVRVYISRKNLTIPNTPLSFLSFNNKLSQKGHPKDMV